MREFYLLFLGYIFILLAGLINLGILTEEGAGAAVFSFAGLSFFALEICISRIEDAIKSLKEGN